MVVLDLFVQRRGFLRRLHPQFVRQDAPAFVELFQCGAAHVAQRQRAHQAAVILLVPGFEQNQPFPVFTGRTVIAAGFVDQDQFPERLGHPALVFFPLHQRPFIEL